MSGLEKIIAYIENEAQQQIAAKLTQASEEARSIHEAAQQEITTKVEAIRIQTEQQVAECRKRGESAAQLEERRLLLETKQQLIEATIEKARRQLEGLSDEAYFEVILKMISRYGVNKEGQIAFSQKDLDRMPKSFEKRLGKLLRLADQPRNIAGGFVLIYGDVEENCSFEALFLAKKEILQDQVGTLLFG